MKLRFWVIIPLIIAWLFSCESEEPTDPIIGTWEWASGSRDITPAGFDRLLFDRSETYLVGDAEYIFTFRNDGTFESSYTPPSMSASVILGNWRFKGDSLILDVTQPQNWEGITRYRLPTSDESNLDLQWSVQYLEFTDAQIDDFRNAGIIDQDWTVDKDSMLTHFGTLITSVITLHFEKTADGN